MKLLVGVLATLVLAAPASGSGIAFEVGGRIHVIAPDGSDDRIVPIGGDASWPAWSPNGRRLAFTSVRGGGTFVVRADGSGLRRVTRSPTLDLQPAWSPDGTRIAFARTVPGFREEIFVVGLDGRGLRRLTWNRGQDLDPDWAPNGKRIAWTFTSTGTRFAQPEIHTMSPSGRAKRRVTPGAAADWSPDGRRFAYVVNGELFTCDVSGGRGRVELTFALEAQASRPAWSPDGARIAFTWTRGDPRGRPRVFTVGAAGGDPGLLSPLVPAGAPSWS